jgi:carbamoyltransferase
MHVLRHFRHQTGQTNLCLAGGVALNCTANGVIKRSRLFRNVFVQPAAGDDGAALGAALHVHARGRDAASTSRLVAPLWGPEFGAAAIEAALARRDDCVARRFESFDALCEAVVERLAAGEILAWFQGRMEFGPRALGNRSILADPRRADMRDRVNLLIKKREGFRPFAPVVTAEAAATYFDIQPGDEETFAHMLFAMPVRAAYRDQLPAITHVDGSARVQSVTRAANERLWLLLSAFGRRCGMPVLLNTSLNVKGQPIVCTPDEAIDTFVRATLDALVIGDHLVTRVGGPS